MDNVKKLKVLYNGTTVGYLAEIGSKIGFQYDDEWEENGFSLSPLSLPLSKKIYTSDSPYFGGLYGVFNDSLPDGWGIYIVRRRLMRDGINYDNLSPLTKLALINDNGLGGLNYIPCLELAGDTSMIFDLDNYSKQIKDLLNDKDADLDEIFRLCGSSGGARPKAHVKDWIIKFPSSYDPDSVGEQEYNANEKACKCGITLPEYKLFPSKICSGYFGSKRFDRCDGKRIHTISLAAVLETTHRIPNMDYIHLFKVIKEICPQADLYEAFNRMCFNVIFGNKDDHSKNFSFIYDEKIKHYRLSPAYDLTKTPDKLEHEMTVNGKENPDEKDLMKVAEIMNLSLQKCKEILLKVKKVVG